MENETQNAASDAKGGSPEAFARLYERVSPALETWARVRVRGALARHADAEDLVQEVWWRALELFPRYREEEGRFRAWLFGVANNVFRAMLRRRTGQRDAGAARRHLDLEDLGAELSAQLTSITKQARRRENVNALAAFVLELEDEDQKLFVHRGLEELPAADVAAILGISENAVHKRWARLRKRLQSVPVWRAFEDDAQP